jgi:hypothetical protein
MFVNLIKNFNKYFLASLFVVIFLPSVLYAADLNVLPTSTTLAVGDTYTATLQVKSPSTSINAVSGTLSFPTELLSVVSISRTGSIVNFWAQEPTFSNTIGAVNFEGVVMSPGFTGSQGKILQVTFRAKHTGSGIIKLTNGSVLANDGEGTNVLALLGESTLVVTKAPQTIEEVVPTSELRAPSIVSITHPDPTKWYQARDIRVSWDLPNAVTKVFAGINQKEDTVPVIATRNVRDYFELHNAHDGVWYAHAKLATASAISPTAHLKIQIDTTAPEAFTFEESNTSDTIRGHFVLTANDTMSGIAEYRFSIDGEPNYSVDVKDITGEYTTPVLAMGTHTITGSVFDKAGNATSKTLTFQTSGLMTPKITESPDTVKKATPFEVKGHGDANIKVVISMEKAGVGVLSEEVRTDGVGDFVAQIAQTLTPGTYELYVQEKEDQITSERSLPVSIHIKNGLFSQILVMLGSYWWVGLILIGLLLLTIFIKRLTRQRPAGRIVGGSMVIHHAVGAELAVLEKIKKGESFSPEERHFLSQLRRDLGFIDQSTNLGEPTRSPAQRLHDIEAMSKKTVK